LILTSLRMALSLLSMSRQSFGVMIGVFLSTSHGLSLSICLSDLFNFLTLVFWCVFWSVFITIVTFFLLFTRIPEPSGEVPRQISLWATFLGVSSALLAAIQYAPQLSRTYRLKLVGALSIPMMIIQSPGAAIMSISIALR
jgi:hypothetical protein